MKNQMFKKILCIKISFLFLLLSCGMAKVVFSEVLPEEQAPILLGVNGGNKNAAPLVRLAQNQITGSNNEIVGEIVSLNTKEIGLSSVVSIESTQPIQYTAFKLLNPLRLVLDFPEMSPGNLTNRIQVDKGIVDFIRPIHFKESGVLRLEIVLNQSADYEIKKPGKNKLTVNLQSSEPIQGEEMAQSSPVVTPESSKKEEVASATELQDDGNRDTCFPMLYGKKEEISLDFQNADVRNFFRTFSEISGFNVIISSEVSGLI
ncbi:MAG: AMIN domain-containing protein, partial [Nitrospinae bacterium]|nr:AMIN domain-containing protein [Nitrospinota bacterium]